MVCYFRPPDNPNAPDALAEVCGTVRRSSGKPYAFPKMSRIQILRTTQGDQGGAGCRFCHGLHQHFAASLAPHIRLNHNLENLNRRAIPINRIIQIANADIPALKHENAPFADLFRNSGFWDKSDGAGFLFCQADAKLNVLRFRRNHRQCFRRLNAHG